MPFSPRSAARDHRHCTHGVSTDAGRLAKRSDHSRIFTNETQGWSIGSRRYDPTSDENRAYFGKPRLPLVVLVALDNGDPVVSLPDRELGSRGECLVERHCGVIGPKDP